MGHQLATIAQWLQNMMFLDRIPPEMSAYRPIPGHNAARNQKQLAVILKKAPFLRLESVLA